MLSVIISTMLLFAFFVCIFRALFKVLFSKKENAQKSSWMNLLFAAIIGVIFVFTLDPSMEYIVNSKDKDIAVVEEEVELTEPANDQSENVSNSTSADDTKTDTSSDKEDKPPVSKEITEAEEKYGVKIPEEEANRLTKLIESVKNIGKEPKDTNPTDKKESSESEEKQSSPSENKSDKSVNTDSKPDKEASPDKSTEKEEINMGELEDIEVSDIEVVD